MSQFFNTIGAGQTQQIISEIDNDNPTGQVDQYTLLALDEALMDGWKYEVRAWSVVFHEKGSSEDAIYDQLVQIFDTQGKLIKEVRGSSEPNPYKPKSPYITGEAAYPYVQGGVYQIEHGTHHSKPALVLNSNGNVPTINFNPNYPEQGENANYIHVHWGYSKTWKGSAGCMTIHPDD